MRQSDLQPANPSEMTPCSLLNHPYFAVIADDIHQIRAPWASPNRPSQLLRPSQPSRAPGCPRASLVPTPSKPSGHYQRQAAQLCSNRWQRSGRWQPARMHPRSTFAVSCVHQDAKVMQVRVRWRYCIPPSFLDDASTHVRCRPP